MSVFDVELDRLNGGAVDRSELDGKVVLVVNVASRCGLTPQYAGLERLHRTFAATGGFMVVGVPCNQFLEQEPGTPQDIQDFCRTTYDVTFPLTAKTDVNGPERHPLYTSLVAHPDADGAAGDVEWNFEKFLVSRDGDVLHRFRPNTEPEDDRIVSAIYRAVALSA